MPVVELEPGTTAELTQSGTEFLTALFAKHDLDKDGALSPQELISLFSTCPTTPWGPEVYHQAVTNITDWLRWVQLCGIRDKCKRPESGR